MVATPSYAVLVQGQPVAHVVIEPGTDAALVAEVADRLRRAVDLSDAVTMPCSCIDERWSALGIELAALGPERFERAMRAARAAAVDDAA